MTTFDELRFPSATGYPDYSKPYILGIEGGLIASQTSTIKISGVNFVEQHTFAALVPKGTSYDSAIAITNIFKNPLECVIELVAPDPGDYDLIIACGESVSDRFTVMVLPPLSEGGAKSNVISFVNYDKLKVGNEYDNLAESELDILYYRNTAPKQKNDGIYTTSRGFLAFPQLKVTKSLKQTISFVYFCSSDSRYFVFGLAGERQRWNSNSYGYLDIGVRLRAFRGFYGQYGQSAEGRNCYQQYEQYGYGDRNVFMRCDITNSGDKGGKAKLYQLVDGKPENWLNGELVASEDLFDYPSRQSENLIPGVWDYLGSNNYLMGVVVR